MSADLRRRRLRLRGRRAETDALDELLRGVLAGRSGVLILRGEAGIGKSALLNSLSGQLDGWHVARAVGVESELELAYNGLHQICSPHARRAGTTAGATARCAGDRVRP